MNEKQIIKKQIKNTKIAIKWDYDRIATVRKRMEESVDYIKELDEQIAVNKKLLKLYKNILEDLKNGK